MISLLRPGMVCAERGSKKGKGQPLVVVRLVAENGSVFFDGLANSNDGGICHGHGSTAHFLELWEPTGAVITFAGAWKMYRNERDRRYRLQRFIAHTAEALARGPRRTRRDRTRW